MAHKEDLVPVSHIRCPSIPSTFGFCFPKRRLPKVDGDRRAHVGVKGIEVYPLADVDSTPGTRALWGGTKTQCGQSMTATSLENVAGRFAITVASP